jgi:PEP-CTERM motif
MFRHRQKYGGSARADRLKTMKQSAKTGGIFAMSILGGTIMLTAPASANLTLAITYDFDSDPGITVPQEQQVENAFNAVAAQFQNAITNPITVNVEVSVGTINGSNVTLPSGHVSGDFTTSVQMGTATTSFANTVAALANTGAVLPTTDPTGGNHFFVIPQAEFKALGLPIAGHAALLAYDGYIGFSSNLSQFSFSGTPGGLQTSFQAAAQHEIIEVLGRISSLNNGGAVSNLFAYPLDLLRYSSPGVSSFSENAAAYASTDGGVTDLGTFNSDPANSLDRSDWSTPNNSTSTDEQNAQLFTGENLGPSISDEDVLKGLGYTFTPDNGDGLFNGANAPLGATPGVNTVPEPASLTLLAAGAGFIGVMRRRVRRPAGG